LTLHASHLHFAQVQGCAGERAPQHSENRWWAALREVIILATSARRGAARLPIFQYRFGQLTEATLG